MRTMNYLLCLAIAFAPGCSVLMPPTQTLTVRSNEDARVYICGTYVGQGIGSSQVARNRAHTVHAELDGESRYATVGVRISEAGVLDVVGGLFFLVPFVGVVAPGFWSLENEVVQLPIGPGPMTPAPAPELEPQPERPASPNPFWKNYDPVTVLTPEAN